MSNSESEYKEREREITWRLMAEDDGYGGTRYYRKRLPGYIDPNVLWYPVGLFVLIAICGAVLKAFDFLAAYSGYFFFLIIPAFALLGVVQYPVVRIADKIRRVRYSDHPFLRRWFKVSVVMVGLAIAYPIMLLAMAAIFKTPPVEHWVRLLTH